jgi:CelD/BcsL family acetyltransferase involved in cellulose biosynthesis
MPEATIEFIVVTDDDGFRGLEEDWRRLSGAVDPSHFFQSFDWCWYAWECLSSKLGRRLCLLVGKAGGQVVLIWPLMIAGRFLRVLGSDLFEFHDVLILPGPQRNIWLAAALHAAKRLGGAALLLREVRQDADLADFLAHLKADGRSRTANKTSVLDLSRFPDWQSYFETLPKQLRGDQRRQWKRLAELSSPARFEVVENRDDQLDLIRWMHSEKARWLEAHGMPGELFGSENYQNFLCSVVSALARKNMVMTCRIVSGGETLAALLGFFRRDYFVFFMFAYDPKWAAYSPGRLVMAKTIEWCYEHQIRTFDMLVGREDYKALWSNSELPVGDYFIPLTVEGRIIGAWHGMGCSRFFARPWFTTISRCAPARLRRAIGGRLASQQELITEMTPL